MRKIILISTLLLFFAGILPAQIGYRRDVKQAERKAEKLAQDGWQIVLDPIEQVPQSKSNRFSAAAQSNWGQRLILPDSVKARLQAECKNPGQIEVFDTGGKWSHPYLQKGQLPGSSYTGEPSLDDGNGHSTHCAGIIAADEFGILDALIDNGICKTKPVKVLTNGGSGGFDQVAAAITTEDAQHAALIRAGGFVVASCSFGGGTAQQANVETALSRSVALGDMYYVFAAGNTGGPVNYPGNSKHAITCASLDENLAVSSYSSRGPEITAAQPGRGINSTYLNGTFAVLSGTSMATPFLASAVFIAKSKWGAKIKGYEAMEAYLGKIARDLPPTGYDNASGYGAVFISAILNTDPSKSGPPNPGPGQPPTPPTGPPTREARTLNFTLTGKWAMTWGMVGTANKVEPQILTKKLLKQTVAKSATQTVYITRLDVDLKTNLFAPQALATLTTEATEYFRNRGLMLDQGSDYVDAVHWTTYFLDLILLQEKKVDIRIRGVTGEDEKGNSITIPAERMRVWPPGSTAAKTDANDED